jgi:hypothetical protein
MPLRAGDPGLTGQQWHPIQKLIVPVNIIPSGAGIGDLIPKQRRKIIIYVIRPLFPKRSWTADERTAPKIKSQEAVCIPRDADPDALPDFAGFVITASEP